MGTYSWLDLDKIGSFLTYISCQIITLYFNYCLWSIITLTTAIYIWIYLLFMHTFRSVYLKSPICRSIIYIHCGGLKKMFLIVSGIESLVSSWWNCLGRFKRSGLAGGHMYLQMDSSSSHHACDWNASLLYWWWTLTLWYHKPK